MIFTFVRNIYYIFVNHSPALRQTLSEKNTGFTRSSLNLLPNITKPSHFYSVISLFYIFCKNTHAKAKINASTLPRIYSLTPLHRSSRACYNPPMNIRQFLEDPTVFGVNKLAPRTASWPSSRIEIGDDDFLYDVADWSLCLNDAWHFRWFPDVPPAPDGFEQPSFDDSGWNTIDLPANWECLGFGTPLYSNYTYPFPSDPPRISTPAPADWTTAREPNPTARLRRRLILPENWAGRLVRLAFGGAQTALMVWCNGAFVGYSEDSMGVAEFDLTDKLQPGENTIALEICKYSSASYLEDQDFWRLSGIFRDVFLYAVDPKHLVDAAIHADALTGTISAEVELSPAAQDCTVELHCRGRVATLPHAIILDAFQLWNAETPFLYTVSLVLRDADGIRDIRHFRTGFRTEAIRDGVFYLNDVPIKLRGVNRHEHDPQRGRAITRESLFVDIRLIKQANFNAVRSSHYPNHPLWYELCDRTGLYVCDEANLESHGLSYHKCVLPGDDPVWIPAAVDRVERLVRMNRNHVCITLWSLGNEAGYGTAFEAARDKIRQYDPRPIQYADMNIVAEFDSQTYPPAAWLEDYIAGTAVRKGEQGQSSNERQHGSQPTNKPFLMNEYAHAMGNSTGGFAEYWEIIEKHPRLTGGFLWEWCEHALLKAGHYAYGGDFGDKPNDGNFCCDGLVRADRTPNPGYHEVKFVQQPFAATLDRKYQTLSFQNRFSFRTLEGYVVNWSLLANGHEVSAGSWDAPLAPGKWAVKPYPAAVPLSAECFWRLNLVRSSDGFLVAACELPLDEASELSASVLPAPNPLWQEPTDVKPATTPLVDVTPLFDRALTDNDRGCRFPAHAKASGEVSWATAGDKRLMRLTYQTAAEPARIGIVLRLEKKDIARVIWYGRGPHENYCDRKRSALVGLYSSAPLDLATPYTRPQENGQRCDVRYLELVAEDGSVTRISAPRLFGFTLRCYSTEHLARAHHQEEIVDEGFWELILDAAQRGVGGDDSWGKDVLPPYRLVPGKGTAVFSFTKTRTTPSAP